MKKLLLPLIAASVSLNCFGSKLDKNFKTVTNGGLTLELNFEQAEGYGQQRYVTAAKEWLKYVLSVDDKQSHTIYIDVIIQDDLDSDGMATIEEFQSGMPYHGVIWMHSNTHEQDFDPDNYKATIMHEFGHIFGVGTMTENFIKHVDDIDGLGFCMENSKAVKAYNENYDRDYQCLPFAESGHLYDYIMADDQKRGADSNGYEIKPMTNELMANGESIGIITLSLIDDLGFEVNQ